MNRRGFLMGLGATAPAFILAPSLMKVSAAAMPIQPRWTREHVKTWLYGGMYNMPKDLSSPLPINALRLANLPIATNILNRQRGLPTNDLYQQIADRWNAEGKFNV